MNACLTCLRPVTTGDRHHPRCARRMFGTDVAPRLDLRESEVCHPQLSLLINHQIRRFDVSMDNSQLMRVMQGLRRLNPNLNDAFEDVPFCPGRL